MKKIFTVILFVIIAAISLSACGSNKQSNAQDSPDLTKAKEKAPEDYTGTVVVYSSHDEGPLNAGVNMFMAKYPNINVEEVVAGTGNFVTV